MAGRPPGPSPAAPIGPPPDLAASVAGEEDPGASLDLSLPTASAAAPPRLPDAAAATPDPMPPRQKLETRAGWLEYTLSGHGPATIVLFNGAGVTLDGWQALYPEIESIGRVFAWNRFGLQGSDEPPPLQDGELIVASVRELMAQAGLRPPYVLVGHSLGGLHANLFARLHPDEVAALLLIEATHPRDDEVLQQDASQLSRGLAKVLAEPPEQFEANLRAELEAAPETVQQVRTAGPFPRVPVAVISGAMEPPKSLLPPDAAQARQARQEALARLSPDGEHVIAARSGHFPQRSEPELVLAVLRRLIERALPPAP
ncbi:alpha/beta hydrolase [Ramlibacter sp.]|uniref:alpha/beta fold hydrolase n=1 Tax=Ramlibacter sp. TaxID=1917967 RepID=UPI002B725EC5|nr:alpha/beta hydrolase [Ramlibacter sp.]HWI83931.1 alpha/beta hydrolase [Ramlibacter sp.]